MKQLLHVCMIVIAAHSYAFHLHAQQTALLVPQIDGDWWQIDDQSSITIVL